VERVGDDPPAMSVERVVHSLNPLVLLLAFAVACQREATRQTADSPRARELAPQATSVSDSGTHRTSPSLSPVAVDARAACDSIAKRWRAVSFAHVDVRDTVANPINRDALHPNLPDEELPPVAACLVAARADSGLVKGSDLLDWKVPGWTPILSMSADGPDGSSLTYQRLLVRCHVSNSWDGDDDSDSTYVPQKWVEQRTTCWHHNRALIGADTAQVP
jgi:hypothetical protein